MTLEIPQDFSSPWRLAAAFAFNLATSAFKSESNSVKSSKINWFTVDVANRKPLGIQNDFLCLSEHTFSKHVNHIDMQIEFPSFLLFFSFKSGSTFLPTERRLEVTSQQQIHPVLIYRSRKRDWARKNFAHQSQLNHLACVSSDATAPVGHRFQPQLAPYHQNDFSLFVCSFAFTGGSGYKKHYCLLRKVVVLCVIRSFNASSFFPTSRNRAFSSMLSCFHWFWVPAGTKKRKKERNF